MEEKDINKVLKEFDEKYCIPSLKEMPVKYHKGLTMLFKDQKDFIEKKLKEL